MSQRVAGTGSTLFIYSQRKGKNIVLYGVDWAVHIHLRMSGRVYLMNSVSSDGEQVAKAYRHSKMVMAMHSEQDDEKSFRLVFTDSRGFGTYAKLSYTTADRQFYVIKKLGIDPTYNEEWTIPNFVKALRKYPNQAVGTALINQELIAGIGNIYRAEILHYAGIHPQRPCSSLGAADIENLFQGTTVILNEAILHRGTSMLGQQSTYRDIHSQRGQHAFHLHVYQREGLDCLNCGTGKITSLDIEKMRRIYFCSSCQV